MLILSKKQKSAIGNEATRLLPTLSPEQGWPSHEVCSILPLLCRLF
jgi:hypothetical protein